MKMEVPKQFESAELDIADLRSNFVQKKVFAIWAEGRGFDLNDTKQRHDAAKYWTQGDEDGWAGRYRQYLATIGDEFEAALAKKDAALLESVNNMYYLDLTDTGSVEQFLNAIRPTESTPLDDVDHLNEESIAA